MYIIDKWMCSWPLQLYQIFFIKNLFILYISMLIIIHKMLNGTDAIASSTLLKNTRNSNNYNMWNHWIRNKVSVIYKVEDRYNCTSIPRGVIWSGKKEIYLNIFFIIRWNLIEETSLIDRRFKLFSGVGMIVLLNGVA